jgi:RNA polymerase sigma-70 factor, ECF subfamily
MDLLLFWLKQRDVRAYLELDVRYRNIMLGYAARRLVSGRNRNVMDVSDAAEVVQEAFLELLCLTSPPKHPVKQWLFRVLGSKICNCWRKRKRGGGPMTSIDAAQSGAPNDPPDPAMPIPDKAIVNEEAATVSTCLDSLPEGGRTAMLLRYFEGLGLQEIADQMNLSKAAVNTILFKARRQLGVCLKRKGLGEEPKDAKC